MRLRDFQDKFVSDIRAAYMRGAKSVLGCAPTGSGKTVIAAHIINQIVQRNQRVLFACHRDELVKQTAHKLSAYGVPFGTLSGGTHHRKWNPVQVATIQSAIRRDLGNVDWLFFDECHLSKAASWTKLRQRYASSRLLGLSATPTRLSGEGFADMYDELVLGPSTAELIAGGYLCPYRLYAPSLPDLGAVHTSGGDYKQDELSTVMSESKLVGSIPAHWRKLASDRLTLVFCVTRQHSRMVAQQFQSEGIAAEHIDGSLPREERKAILARFGPQTRVLCSVLLFTEGFDRPDISALILARPTKSLALHLQMMGRGLRIADGKSDCLILDHSGNTLRHGFPDDDRIWTLDARKRKPREVIMMPQLPRVCPVCMYVNRFNAMRCAGDGCDYEFSAVARREIEHVDGELQEITPTRDRSSYGQPTGDPVMDKVRQIAFEKQYKPGYVWHKQRRLDIARQEYIALYQQEPRDYWNEATLNALIEKRKNESSNSVIRNAVTQLDAVGQ